jgi:hypothetical protein
MDHTHILLIAAAVALGLSVVLRWIFTPRHKPRDSGARATQAQRAAAADGAWDGAARRRRDLVT